LLLKSRGGRHGPDTPSPSIADGEAEFITGGKMVDPKVTAPGQTRGTGIEGGVSHHLTKGDVITIPAKTSKSGPVGYYAVNFDSN
jgi:hypothetical protein